MDVKTLRALVIEHKDLGMSYQEISDMLEREYNVVRSRQALQGMYTRAIDRRNRELENKKSKICIIADIVNIHCLGYNKTEITRIIKSLGHNLSYRRVVSIVNSQDKYIKEVETAIGNRVADKLGSIEYISELKDIIKYKEVSITDKKINEYIVMGYNIIINNKINEVLSEVYKMTDDRGIVRQVANNIDFKLDFENFRGNI